MASCIKRNTQNPTKDIDKLFCLYEDLKKTGIPTTILPITLGVGTAGNTPSWSQSTIIGGDTLTLNIPDASTLSRGLVNTNTQTFVGAKTFNTSISSPYATLGGILLAPSTTVNAYIPNGNSGIVATFKSTINNSASGDSTGMTAVGVYGIHIGYERGTQTVGTVVGVRGEADFRGFSAERLDGIQAVAGIGREAAVSNGNANFGSGVHIISPVADGGYTGRFLNYASLEIEPVSASIMGNANIPYTLLTKGTEGIARVEQIAVEYPNLPAYTTGGRSTVALNSTTKRLEIVPMILSKAGVPTTSDILNNEYKVVKNTSNGELRLYVNDGGTLKSVLLT